MTGMLRLDLWQNFHQNFPFSFSLPLSSSDTASHSSSHQILFHLSWFIVLATKSWFYSISVNVTCILILLLLFLILTVLLKEGENIYLGMNVGNVTSMFCLFWHGIYAESCEVSAKVYLNLLSACFSHKHILYLNYINMSQDFRAVFLL